MERLEDRLLLASDVSYTNTVLADNPIVYYEFDELSGSVAADSSTSGANHPGAYLTGSLLNQPSAASGLGGAVDLDGVSAVRIADHSDFDIGTGDFTVEVWLRADAGDRGDLFTYKDGAADLGVHYASQGAGTISVYLTDSFAMGPSPAAQGSWRHVVATRENGENRLYIDAVEVDTFTQAGGPHSFNVANDLLVGANHFGDPDDLKFSFEGAIDEFALYNTSLSASRIAAHHSAGLAATTVNYSFEADSFVVGEGDAAQTSTLVAVTRDSATTAESLDVQFSGVSAVAGEDFQAEPVRLSFGVGELRKTVPIEILGDKTVELNETLELSLVDFSENGEDGGPHPTATLTIANDDVAAVSITNATAAEGSSSAAGKLVFNASLSNPVDYQVSFAYQTVEGSAVSGVDFLASSGQAVFAAGETSTTITVDLIGDNLVELQEQLTLAVQTLEAGGRQVALPGGGANIVVNGDFELPAIHAEYETVAATSDRIVGWKVGDVSVDIAKPLSGAQSGSQMIDLAGTPGPGSLAQTLETVAGLEYDLTFYVSSNNGPHPDALDVEWNGNIIATISAPAEGQFDSHSFTVVASAAETVLEFAGRISGNQGATLDKVSVTPRAQTPTGIIDNDDSAVISIADASVVESDGSASIAFEMSLSNPVDHEVSVEYESVDDVAVSQGAGLGDSDFNAVSGVAVIAAEAEEVSITVTVNGDNLEETDESFFLDLIASSLSAGGRDVSILDARGEGQIRNDDAAPVLDSAVRFAQESRIQINEGDELSLDASRATDADDGAAAIQFRWDVDGDGDFDENVQGSQPTLSRSQLAGLGMADGPFSTTLTLEMTDGTNVTRIAKPLTVNNVAAVFDSLVSSAADLQHKTDAEVSLAGTFSDQALDLDTHQIEIDWGDGSDPQAVTVDQLEDSFRASHVYVHGGIFEIIVTLTDSDGAETTAGAKAVVVGAGLVDDTLYVIGTEGRDSVTVSYTRRNDTLRVKAKLDRAGANRRAFAVVPENEVQSIEIYLCAGNDQVQLAHRGRQAVVTPSLIDAGAGNDRVDGGNGPDTILGGAGRDIIFGRGGRDAIFGQAGNDRMFGGTGNDSLSGGAGNDWIFGASGRDILVGGIGRDKLFGGNGEDLIIGGSSASSEHLAAMQSALNAWSDNDLTEALIQLGTIVDDDEVDLLVGGWKRDHLYGGQGDRQRE